jgi:hypothetical protein
MELVDGQDDEAAKRQNNRDRRQRNLVVRPRITISIGWHDLPARMDHSIFLIAREEPADDAPSEKKGFGFTKD